MHLDLYGNKINFLDFSNSSLKTHLLRLYQNNHLIEKNIIINKIEKKEIIPKNV